MVEVIERIFSFEKKVFLSNLELYGRLARHGQSPQALIIACADSRIAPEHIMQAEPGDLFVTRNVGNIVPPFSQANGGVTSVVEYAVTALGVRDIVVCGHSDCGAMKALARPEALAQMPNVSAWLRHAEAARKVVDELDPGLDDKARLHAVALENINVQLTQLKTHPSVAAAIAQGRLALHGWFVDIHAGEILALNAENGAFVAVREGNTLPVAMPRRSPRALSSGRQAAGAELRA
ncbi:carbonic anhydrase [Mesorhizobium albiziae]|uniref:Carbonic anhydrase n=1 Tax=Neomesorhizobium albiziae TaxID=335020 RepID=A0A1I3WKC1_9HYPH|nr:carbonic anhydrase [Mesorhizobium albiziae]SFK08134.1 carbonic anhydrase [Mesorhizobium albiziae]